MFREIVNDFAYFHIIYVSRKNIKQRIISEKIKTLILSVMWHTIAIYIRIIIQPQRSQRPSERDKED